jgi:hypothetical protein
MKFQLRRLSANSRFLVSDTEIAVSNRYLSTTASGRSALSLPRPSITTALRPAVRCAVVTRAAGFDAIHVVIIIFTDIKSSHRRHWLGAY